MAEGRVGYMDTPAQGNVRPAGVTWAADTGCYGRAFDPGKWWRWLSRQDPAGCLFATAPDVVGDHAATLDRSLPWLPRVRQLGLPAAFCAQDGATPAGVPWDDLDAVFIGGTTAWKLGPAAAAIASAALARGKHLHMGRVNSWRRWAYAESLGCESADGTYLVFGPGPNTPRLLGWAAQPSLFGGAA
ncbi:MAG: hypothetical protein LBQ06_01200 [Frankiaceae bacterium]|jgi:hypothetical protein|nr:hypothetical protein [Frankiaceae bacterium]